MSLAALQTNAARLGQRLSETISESTRDIPNLAGGLNGGAFDALSTEEKISQVKKQLDSNSEREKLDALKKLLGTLSKPATMANGQHSTFFPLVVKNVASTSLEVRKLVYIYLLRFAHLEPDLALLSINTFQKDLGDSNPLIRAMALRVLSGIGVKVSVVQAVVQLAVKKCAGDPSPYVRKSAALSLIKCYEADPSSNAHLPILTTLLADRSPLSLGAIAMAALVVTPSSYQLYHQHYRRYCTSLPDIDAWGQCYMLQLLGRYARENLPRPDGEQSLDADLTLLLEASKPLFYSQNSATVLAAVRLFRAIAPINLANENTVQPLLRLLHSELPIRRVLLSYILSLVSDDPKPWIPHASVFILRATDNAILKILKLKVLMKLQTPSNIRFLERELTYYTDDPNPEVAQLAVRSLGICALRGEDGSEAEKVLLQLADSVDVSEIKTAAVVAVLMALITHLYTHTEPKQRTKARRIVAKLTKAYLGEKLQSAQARSRALWVAGSYAEVANGEIEDWAPDVLRIAVRAFSGEEEPVKLQTLSLGAKLGVLTTPNSRYYGPVQQLISYLLALAKQDRSINVRDRTRFLETLLMGAGVIEPFKRQDRTSWDEPEEASPSMVDVGGVKLRREQVRVVLLEGVRSVPLQVEDDRQYPAATFGSLSAVLDRDQTSTELGTEAGISERFPEWCAVPTDPSIRHVEVVPQPQVQGYAGPSSSTPTAPRFIASTPGSGVATPNFQTPSPVGSVGNTKGNWKDLDEFYASDGSEEEEDGDEEEEEEEQEEEQEEESEAEESEQGSDSVSTQEGSQEMERSKHALLTGSQGQSTTQKLDDFYD